MQCKKYTRRAFIKICTVAGGGFLIGVVPTGCTIVPQSNLKNKKRDFRPNAWIRITVENEITIYVDRSEMGQGVMTSLPMLIAEELCVDLNKVNIQFATGEPEYANPMFDVQVTVASTSISDAWDNLRIAGCTAREILIAAAAKLWDEPINDCKAQNGEVFSIKTAKRESYGELTAIAPQISLNGSALRNIDQFEIIGTSFPRVDGLSKIDGSAIFGTDIQLPEMLTAVIARPPYIRAKPADYKVDAALNIPGVHHVCMIESGIAVVAETFWQAIKAREALAVEWEPNLVRKDEESIWTGFIKASKRQSARVVCSVGDYRSPKLGARTVKSEYRLPYLAHATMEPMNCTAHVIDGTCRIWAPTQNPAGARMVAADITKLPMSSINVHVTYLGCGLGRRLEVDFIAEAVELSMQTSVPVKVMWTREDDMLHDFYRPAALCQLEAVIDDTGLVGWHHRTISTSVWKRIAAQYADLLYLRRMPKHIRKLGILAASWASQIKADPNISEGATDLPYSIRNVLVDYIEHDPELPTGPLRSVSYSINIFAVESFIDEIAPVCNMNPYDLRRHLLRNNPRLLRLMDIAKSEATKNQRTNSCCGIATYTIMGTHVAMIAEVEYSQQMTTRIVRIVCAIDCGIVVNPDLVRAQVEGGIVFGLGSTLKHAITMRNGRIEQDNFDSYPLISYRDMPKIEVYIASSNLRPTGAGEASIPGVAPAVSNAIFAATGKRCRRLPLVYD